MDQLLALKEIYPLIGNVAGKGLHIGVDLVKDQSTKERACREAEAIMYHCMNEGIAFKLIEGNIITIRPALTVTKGHCDSIIAALKNAFEGLPQ
jgi:4-aminobutyrate aminotransferase